MQKGSFLQYVIKGHTVDSFLNAYEWALAQSGFEVKEKIWDGRAVHHKAIFGSKAGSFLITHLIPFGSLTEEGNRYGAEAEIYQYGQDVVFRLLILPYMSLFDRSDIFLITQGIFEKMVDDNRCRNKAAEIAHRVASIGTQMFIF